MSYAKLAIAIVAFFAGWTVQSWRYGEQIATMQKEAAEATTKAVQEAREEERADQKRINDALREANLRAQKNQALARALDGDIDRLRAQLATDTANLSQASLEASRKYAATVAELFGSCTKEYLDMAGKAQGHAEDARLMREAWPVR